MRVGHGTAPLPVAEGTAMGGYAARHGAASGLLDELAVVCLTFGGPAGRFALIVADVLCVNEDAAASVRREVRRALGAVVDVWVAATHTHSGPEAGCRAGGGRTPGPLLRALTDAAAAAARAAVASEHELAGRFHAGALRGIGSRRGDEDGEPVVSLDVVSCASADDRLRGVLAVVPVHPTVLPAASTVISGDLAAAIRASLGAELGGAPAPWVVVATGAAGDISTRRTRRAQTAEECRRLGAAAAGQIAALLRTPPAPLWEVGDGGCAATRRRLALPGRRHDRRELGALRARLQDDHARERERGATAAARTLETTLQGIDVAQAQDARPPGTVPLALSAARLGQLSLLGLGGEPFHSFSGEVRARCAGPSVLLGYVNGHAGYLPDAPAYATAGYEALSSPFRRDAGATALAALIDLLPDTTEA